MKIRSTALALAALLVAGTFSAPADAGGRRFHHHRHHHHHGHHGLRFGLFVGVPAFAAWHWSHRHYYPPTVVVRESPPVYIEQASPAPTDAAAQQWWYYCADARMYYPYVKECPGGWMRVAPQQPPR